MENFIKICKVCGDKALGINFNGQTCESCKKFKCRKDGNCFIDFLTRKCCTSCRLDKCFQIGMKKELIWSKLEKDSGYEKSSTSSQMSSELNSEPSPGGSSISSYSESSSTIQQIFDLDICNKVTICSLQKNFNESIIFDIPIQPKMIQSTLTLNSIEMQQINELKKATECAAFYDENRLQLIGEVTDLVYALNLAELYIKKTIKFCKSICAFKHLNQTDQLAILKGFFTELMIIRFAFVFNSEKDGYPVIEDDDRKQAVFIKLNILYAAKKQNVLYYCRHYSSRFHEVLEEDSVIRDLIMAKRLFNSIENISCPEFIRYQYFVYSRLLHRYLEHKYQDINKAYEKMNKINEVLSEMNPVKDILEGIFIQADASQLALVLNEIYHLHDEPYGSC